MKLFTNKHCGLCHEVKKLLAQARVRYVEFDITTPEGMAEYCDAVENDHSLPLLIDEHERQFAGQAAVERATELAQVSCP